METFTKIIRILALTAFTGFVSIYNANAQTILFTEDWESAGIGQTPPSGWGVDIVYGSNYTYFEQTGTNPPCAPFSGNRMVEYQSYNAFAGNTNRLKRTTPIATTGYSYVTVDFEWHVDSLWPGTPQEGVYIQWSTNGTSWTTAGTIFRRYSSTNMWVLETQPLPSGAGNQSTLYIALFFESQVGDNCHLDLVHIRGYTSTPPAPTVTTTAATGIVQNSAVMNGTVNANGYSTTASFQYGLTTSYGYNAQAGTVTGNSATNISASTETFLTPSTLYHYRAVGNSAGGTIYGADMTFTTLAPAPPIVITTAATNVAATCAYLNANVNANGDSTAVHFQYGLTTAYGYTTFNTSVFGSTMTPVSILITSLTPNTTYHYRAVGTNTFGTTNGNDLTFTTLSSSPPMVTTNNATNITSSSSLLNGTVNPNCSYTTTSFQYGLTIAYGNTVSGMIFSGGNYNAPISAMIYGLSANTTYHFRATGTNSYGTTYGNDMTFTTTSSGSLPTVITTHATSIYTQEAILNGNFNANGSTTTAKFEYGTSTSYGTTVIAGTVNGNTLQGMSKQVNYLYPATLYHYRAFATNSYGTSYGLDSTFTTADTVPWVLTLHATNISNTSATLNGWANANGLTTTLSFDWGLTTAYGSNIGASPGTISGNTNQQVTAALTGLISGTTYHCRIKGVNSLGTSYGLDTVFTTAGSGSAPTVITTQATNITSTTATLNGNVNANGFFTTVSFEYGLTTAYGNTVPGGTVTGNNLTPVSAPLYGLSPATLYHYRAVGTNVNGTTYGNDTTFTTLNAAPSVVTLPATNINYTSVTLNGTANANGATTTVSFDYGLTSSYGSNIAATPSTVSGNTIQSVTAALTGLPSGTTYHYRIKGVNSVGTSYGSDQTFTTLSGSALPPTVITSYADMITDFYVRLHGYVNANGSLTTVNFQYGTTTSYGSSVYAGNVSGTSLLLVEAMVYGLSPGTLYHFRVVGSNAGGTAYGDDSTFYTNDTIPTVLTFPATLIGSSTATLNGSVNPNGDVTTTSFQYGLTTSYGSNIAATPGQLYGATPQSIAANLTGLLANHTYHYRAKGVNSFGTAYGVDMTFNTSGGSGCDAIMSYSDAGPLAIQFHDISTGGGTYRLWHFGDGFTSTQTDPLHTYPAPGNYNVELFIHNGTTGCIDSTFQVVQVTDSTIECLAQFTYSADSLNSNVIQFTDLSTGNITGWLWNFDDDSSSVLQNPVHTFPGPGTYYVCLAIDGPDCLNTTCQEIIVGNVPNCISYFTYTHSGLTLNLLGHMVNGLASTYNWSFGDGHTGEGQSIVHQYDTTGVYYVTLTTNDTAHCTYSSGQTVLIGDSAQFLQIYGQVFAGEFPVDAGMVALFSVDTIAPYVPFINISNIDSNGVYYFSMVPQGDFYIYSIPTSSEGYLPTFYGDALYWEDAAIVHLGVPNNPYNINLMAASELMAGNGSINGEMNMTGLKSSGLLGKIVILLMNSEGKTIAYFKVTDQGNFVFPSLAYGTYWIKAELAGVKSDVVMVVLSPEHSQASVVMTFTGIRIIGINEVKPASNSFRIYPNPASDQANIAMHLTETTDISLSLFNVTGQQVYHINKYMKAGNSVISIPVSTLPAGMYTVCIISGNGMQFSSKLIR